MGTSSKPKARTAVSILAACVLAFPMVPVAAFADQGEDESVGVDLGSGSASLVVERNRAYYESTMPNIDLVPEDAEIELVRLGEDSDQANDGLECNGDGYIDQELIVHLEPGTLDSEVQEVLSLCSGISLRSVYGDEDVGLAVFIRLDDDVSAVDAAEDLESDPRVMKVERNYFIDDPVVEKVAPSQMLSDEVPTAAGGYWLEGIDVYSAWNRLFGIASPIEVVVIDSGVNVSNPVFEASDFDMARAYDATTYTVGACTDLTGHGTAVASVLVGNFTHGNTYVSGIADGTKIIPVKTRTDSDETHYVDTIYDAYTYIKGLIQSGVPIKVINQSVGGYHDPDTTGANWMSYFEEAGVTFVASAGNNHENQPHYPSDYEYAVSVAAVDANGRHPEWSNYGPNIDLASYGDWILVPDTTDASGYAYWNGTSLATPMVAGVAALAYWADPTATSAEVRQAMFDSATDVVNKDGDEYQYATGWDQYTGYGIVDAYGTVESMVSLRLTGSSRYATAAAISNYGLCWNMFGHSEYAVVVNGTDAAFPDALCASGLAGVLDAPIVSTSPDGLSSEAAATIASLGASKIVIVGGTSTIPTGVEQQLEALPSVQDVQRVAGSNRYATANEIYEFVIEEGLTWGNSSGYERPEYADNHSWKNPSVGKRMAILVVGSTFADALAASPLSAFAGYPIFLTNGEIVDNTTLQNLRTGGFDELLVVGGTSSVKPEAALDAAAAVAPANISGGSGVWFWRCSGSNRYETSCRISAHALLEGMQPSRTLIASGNSSADATCASALKMPLLLVSSTNADLASHAASFARDNASDISAILVVGGPSSVPGDSVRLVVNGLKLGREEAGGSTGSNISTEFQPLISFLPAYPEGIETVFAGSDHEMM